MSPVFAGAHEINVAQSTFNAAGGDIIHNTTYSNLSTEAILSTLKPVERTGHTDRCMLGTRQDVLKEINHWVDDFTDDSKNILLICGSPGAGKSAIAASAVFDLDERNRLASSFAFKHSDANLSDPSVVWRTVASDLARFHSSLKDSLIGVLKGVDPGRDLSYQFQRLIKEPLTQNHDELLLNPPVIVLDALDECGSDRSQSDDRRRLLDTLTQWCNLPRTFKLIVTSRDERLPNSFRQSCKTITLRTGHRVASETTNDIRHFLQSRFALIAEEYPSLPNWPGDRIIDRLATRAAGLFIWAETLIKFVGNEKSPPDEQLDLVLRGDLGEEGDVISGLYRRILDVSFGNLENRILDALCAVVGTIVLAKVPLLRGDLVHFLNTPVKESIIDLILNKLSSVISIGSTDKLIHICHLSFVDFICNPSQSRQYAVDHSTRSGILASSCFRLMEVGLKFNICGLENSHFLNDEVQDLPSRIAESVPPRLSYSCRFGWQHLRDTSPDGSSRMELMNDIDNFFHVRLLYWLEVMSLIKEIPTALTGLHFMTRWIGTSHTDLAEFAEDSVKFVVNSSTPISTSAPHIYMSALPWSPQKSKVAQHFLPQFQHLLSVSAGAESDWPASVNLFVGHTDYVKSVGFSPDGKRVVSGSDDMTIRIWDAETGEVVAGPFEGHTHFVKSVGFSPDGRRVVSGSYDTTVRIWDANTGEVLAGPLTGHTDLVTSVGFSPDGKRVVSGSEDSSIRIWDSETGELVAGPIEGHTNKVTSVGYSPDGKRVVSGSEDSTIRIWDSKTGRLVTDPFEGHTDGVTSVTFSPDGKRVVSGSEDRTIRIWNSETGVVIAGPLKGHTSSITSVAFSPDGKRVVSGSEDKTILIWDSESGEVVAGPFEGHTTWVTSVGFSPDGKYIVSGSDDMTIHVWDSEMGNMIADQFEYHSDGITSVGFSPDGKRVVSGSYDKTIRIWNSQTGEMVAGPLKGHTYRITSVGFSPDGKRVVSGSDDGTIRIWHSETGEVVAGPFKGHKFRVASVGFSPDGERVVSGSDDMTIRIWDSETGEVVSGPFEGHTLWITSVAFSPDGKQVVSSSFDKTIRIWDSETGVVVAGPFEGHTDCVTSVGFSPDGKRVVSGSDDRMIRIWDSETGKLVAGPFEGHTFLITSVGFSPDGKRIVSGSFDRTIRIWDSETGEEVASPLRGHSRWITSVGFSPDGKLVVSGSRDKTIRIWDVEVDAEDSAEGVSSSVESSSDGKTIVFDLCGQIRGAERPGRFHRCHFDSDTGWITTSDGKGLLFWVPDRHHGRVCGTDTVAIMGQRMMRVDLSSFVHGPHWALCRRRTCEDS